MMKQATKEPNCSSPTVKESTLDSCLVVYLKSVSKGLKVRIPPATPESYPAKKEEMLVAKC
jgi:hypothetical protein